MEADPLKYQVPDNPYNPEDYAPKPKRDKFEEYRALEPEQYQVWMNAIEEASE